MSRIFKMCVVMAALFAGNSMAATISGTVTDQSTSDNLSGVTVLLTAATSPSTSLDTETTGNNGAYAFEGVEQGEYIVTASRTGYVSSINRVRISGQNQNVSLDIMLVPTGNARTGVISGSVTNSANDQPIQGAVMILSRRSGTGPGQIEIAVDTVGTNSSGAYLFGDVLVGLQYSVAAIAAGFMPQEKNQVPVTANDTTDLDFELVAMPDPTAGIVGTVSDSVSGSAIAGAQVVLRLGMTSGGQGGSRITWVPVDTITTSTSGTFTFDSISPNGNENPYSLEVAAPLYHTFRSSNITVTADETDTVNVLLRRLSTGAANPAVNSTGTTPAIRYVKGSLVVGPMADKATIHLFTLCGRELFNTCLSAGAGWIELPRSMTGTASAVVVSVRGADFRIERTILIGR
ncbi:MAG: carboxypeptidase regulatory-like domain-containing protein [Chitinispirillaceae bacterium]|nr:carboxypeptidase regulatory-like domain-containing protein [Chitinispirillaceae bacterium]